MTGQGNHERDFPNSGSDFGGGDSGGECGVPTQARFHMPTCPRPNTKPCVGASALRGGDGAASGDASAAMALNRQRMGNRYIELFRTKQLPNARRSSAASGGAAA